MRSSSARPALGLCLVGLLAVLACGRTLIPAPQSPFPPKSRWEKVLDLPLSSPLASNGTLVFAASSDGSVTAFEPTTGVAAWTRPPGAPATVAARADFVVVVEDAGAVWGINPANGATLWQTATQVANVQSVRLVGNRVFLGGQSGLAAVRVSTGELQFELQAKDVRDIDVAGDTLVCLEEGVLVVRRRDDGGARFRLGE